VTINLDGSPYSLVETGKWAVEKAADLERRVDLLRNEGQLTEQTLRAYFGDTRFEQIAESNAIEGSTLSTGETELAIMQGITVTGHDPAFSRDAINLSNALKRLVELAKEPSATDIDQVKELHGLILADASTASLFRSQPVRISGSPHVPPATWQEVMAGMEDWERWSRNNAEASALLRAIVLHTWLTHIHPFADGNGRTSRAVLNLELIRAGLPSIIIRRKDRLRYYEALAESDLGGDLGPIVELVVERAKDALNRLERAATAQEGYDRARAELIEAQKRQVGIWNDAVRLLFSLIGDALEAAFEDIGRVSTFWYEDELAIDDFVSLSQGSAVGRSWLFRINAEVSGFEGQRYLAWTGYRSDQMRLGQEIGYGPSIFWSVPDQSGDRKWVRDESQSPGFAELTLELPNVDQWIGRLPDGDIRKFRPSRAARRIAESILSEPLAARTLSRRRPQRSAPCD